MFNVGIDVGAKTIKVVILRDGQPFAQYKGLAGMDTAESVEQAYTEALKEAGISRDQVKRVVSTGVGRKEVPFSDEEVTEVGADSKGIIFVMPNCRTCIDVGAEEGRAIRCDDGGKVRDFAVNEKCAAGAGSFVESMSRALELKLHEMGELSLKATRTVPMNAQCAVFAESEVVSLIHSDTTKEDIARSVHDAIASRIISMVRRVGIEPEIALIGGVSHNVGFVECLERGLETKVTIPDNAEFIGALGAALLAYEGSK
ncbi:acyl-CoA dehydratase activase [Heliophilum fasciatum]|uniref:Benzoyl-CoA reductase subunit D n=1 Tax=Heliophilum fasciatum TaxID=35700 RepID=A0A4R2RM05_9FIRM|nr:acyl-CoA dehydratase activase [Heliophilum fasciatum]MCW2278175.1 benzoyl-CoA reductase subunit D [Heliophilum fasciatum]TCP64004.1 benzoyl-CoA reductase subunit D [Heliophilum fasciatum]